MVDRNSLRKHIYKELLRLESAGVLKRHHGETGRGCKFIYRGVPDGISFEIKPSPYGQLDEDNEPTMDLNTVRDLREELSTRKVELMTSIGEAEEYQRLYNKFPALQEIVRTQYLESRDRSTKLLGQLRAVETILADIGFNA
jgi:predicted transcriptional regulator